MKTYGIIGEKLSHTLSPDIHKMVFESLKINGIYTVFEVSKEQCGNIVGSLKTLGIKGVNVTIPYKETVISQVDEISEESKKIGAINTINIKDNVAKGYNTDYLGFGKMLKQNNVAVNGKCISVLGGGGAAKAVVQYLLDNNAKCVTLVSRNIDNIKSKFDNCNFATYDELEKVNGCDLLINTTPVGMYPNVDDCAVDKSIIQKYDTVVDIVYNPIQTKLLKIAKDCGKKTVDGLSMLVYQALESEVIWNNIEISEELTSKIYEDVKSKL